MTFLNFDFLKLVESIYILLHDWAVQVGEQLNVLCVDLHNHWQLLKCQ